MGSDTKLRMCSPWLMGIMCTCPPPRNTSLAASPAASASVPPASRVFTSTSRARVAIAPPSRNASCSRGLLCLRSSRTRSSQGTHSTAGVISSSISQYLSGKKSLPTRATRPVTAGGAFRAFATASMGLRLHPTRSVVIRSVRGSGSSAISSGVRPCRSTTAASPRAVLIGVSSPCPDMLP